MPRSEELRGQIGKNMRSIGEELDTQNKSKEERPREREREEGKTKMENGMQRRGKLTSNRWTDRVVHTAAADIALVCIPRRIQNIVPGRICHRGPLKRGGIPSEHNGGKQKAPENALVCSIKC